MGLISLLKSFTRRNQNDVRSSVTKSDPGGGNLLTSDHFSDAGDDSFPLPGDYQALVKGPRSGETMSIGYADTKNTPKALAGDKRIYARDASTGLVVVEVWLQNDGTATMSNDTGSFTLAPTGSIKGLNGNGSFELEAGGDFAVNGAKIDTNGKITSPVGFVGPSAVINSKELAEHDHKAGTPPGDTGVNQ